MQGKIFNPNSTLQLRGLLFDVLGLKKTGKKTGTGADSTDAEVLKELSEQHPIPALILNIRQHSKILWVVLKFPFPLFGNPLLWDMMATASK